MDCLSDRRGRGYDVSNDDMKSAILKNSNDYISIERVVRSTSYLIPRYRVFGDVASNGPIPVGPDPRWRTAAMLKISNDN